MTDKIGTKITLKKSQDQMRLDKITQDKMK